MQAVGDVPGNVPYSECGDSVICARMLSQGKVEHYTVLDLTRPEDVTTAIVQLNVYLHKAVAHEMSDAMRE